MMESTDRYGGPANWPDPATVCDGPCEGMGVYPAYEPSADKRLSGVRPTDLDDSEAIRVVGATANDDGWVFLTCPTCGGSGKRKEASA